MLSYNYIKFKTWNLDPRVVSQNLQSRSIANLKTKILIIDPKTQIFLVNFKIQNLDLLQITKFKS